MCSVAEALPKSDRPFCCLPSPESLRRRVFCRTAICFDCFSMWFRLPPLTKFKACRSTQLAQEVLWILCSRSGAKDPLFWGSRVGTTLSLSTTHRTKVGVRPPPVPLCFWEGPCDPPNPRSPAPDLENKIQRTCGFEAAWLQPSRNTRRFTGPGTPRSVRGRSP